MLYIMLFINDLAYTQLILSKSVLNAAEFASVPSSLP